MNINNFPFSVDLNVTAKCNLSCSFCWGPNHNIADSMDTSDWKQIIDFFIEKGTKSIVFTGGEPLIRKDIIELAKYCKSFNLHTTLSTNCILLSSKKEILNYIDEIGIPLDGHNVELNTKMRIGNSNQLKYSIEALQLLKDYNHIEVTVRTVISKFNYKNIIDIGNLILKRKRVDRWKLYEFTPIEYGEIYKHEHFIDSNQLNEVISLVEDYFPDINKVFYKAKNRGGKYIFVGPQGDIFGIDEKLNHKTIGVFKKDEDDFLVNGIKNILDYNKNSIHGKKTNY
jgi:MoaA/NifB/PqqE/SkfB family radical SAM enzyme